MSSLAVEKASSVTGYCYSRLHAVAVVCSSRVLFVAGHACFAIRTPGLRGTRGRASPSVLRNRLLDDGRVRHGERTFVATNLPTLPSVASFIVSPLRYRYCR